MNNIDANRITFSECASLGCSAREAAEAGDGRGAGDLKAGLVIEVVTDTMSRGGLGSRERGEGSGEERGERGG